MHNFPLGVPVQTPDGALIARAILLCCSFDLPARAIALNMKQWNGAYGCLYCEDMGTTIGGDHLHRYWPHQDSVQTRTHASVFQNAVDAVRTGNAVSMDRCACIIYRLMFMYMYRSVVLRVLVCWHFILALT